MTWTTSAFKHFRKRKKDGKYQIKIKLRNNSTGYQRDFPVEYLAGEKVHKLVLSESEWSKKTKFQNEAISFALNRYPRIAKFLEKNEEKISNKKLCFYFRKLLIDVDEQVSIDQIRRLLANEFDKSVTFSESEILQVAKNLKESDFHLEDEEQLDEGDVGAVLIDAVSRIPREKNLTEVKKIKDPLKRCDAQYKIPGVFNETRIIDVFGFFWTLKQTNDERYLNKWNTKIILRIAQFIFLTGASNDLKDLDSNWVKNFFLYLRDTGFLDTREIRNYTPLELYSFKKVFEKRKANCKPYSESSFGDQLTKFKRYYSVLFKTTNLLDNSPKIDLDIFTLKTLKFSKTNFDEDFTQKDHYVNVEELELLSEYYSKDERLNLTRDLFFIQTFSSGNRSIEKDVITSKLVDGNTIIEVRHSKTGKINSTGKFRYLAEVMARHNGELPKIEIDAKEFNENLKKIAEELKFERMIKFPENKINTLKTKYAYKPLYECISQYFSRHTLVNYLVDAKTEDSNIIKLTGHSDVRILQHYKKNLKVEEKQVIIDLADETNREKKRLPK
jgi:hypothetical protein